ncbi:MAG: lipid A biosynthesis (KDO)2-(lauroyl)-lipid IVA acyltransferase [Succinivibrionaceae bacterium]
MKKDLVFNQNKDLSYDISLKKEYFKLKYCFSWLLIGLLGILAYIPSCIRDFIANILAQVLYKLPVEFQRITLINLRLAYPNASNSEILKLYKRYLRLGIKVILGYGECFFKSKNAIKKSFEVVGKENFDEALKLNKPIIFMAPHAWAIDHCGLYLSANGLKMCTMMHTSKNHVYDWFMNSMRLKYGGKVFERNSGIKSIIKALRDGYSSFFLPDEDFGMESSVFTSFMGAQKSTLVTLPKLAQLGKAIVVPMFSVYNEKTRKYQVVFGKYFDNYPTSDILVDVRRMNESIENLIEGREEQYMWFLRLYRTRPIGEDQDIYGKGKTFDQIKKSL